MWLVLIPMTLFGAMGGFYLKKAASRPFLELFRCGSFYLGAFLYGAAALMNIYVLQKADYSVVLPLTSITYVWTFLIAYRFLGEKVTPPKVLGVLLIIAGAFVIAL